MSKIKLCGLSRACDIAAANALKPDYVGFVFAPQSKRCIDPARAAQLKHQLEADILAVGVFSDSAPEEVAALLNAGIIDLAQLHGQEDETYIASLRRLSSKPLIQAFRLQTAADLARAEKSSADYILLDGGAGAGRCFEWRLLDEAKREYFLAGGLDAAKAVEAVQKYQPFAVDVSSGIESGGVKDKNKMAAFVAAVRKEKKL